MHFSKTLTHWNRQVCKCFNLKKCLHISCHGEICLMNAINWVQELVQVIKISLIYEFRQYNFKFVLQ